MGTQKRTLCTSYWKLPLQVRGNERKSLLLLQRLLLLQLQHCLTCLSSANNLNETLQKSSWLLVDLYFVAAGAWSLLDVCCMCASSKLLGSAWLQLLKQQPSPSWLVAAAADAAQASTPSLQAKATKVMRWLLKSLPEARLAQQPSALAGLLSIPRMPHSLAFQLCSVEVGVRMSYADIAAAARRGVPGEM
jgi:hypothetical protein